MSVDFGSPGALVGVSSVAASGVPASGYNLTIVLSPSVTSGVSAVSASAPVTVIPSCDSVNLALSVTVGIVASVSSGVATLPSASINVVLSEVHWARAAGLSLGCGSDGSLLVSAAVVAGSASVSSNACLSNSSIPGIESV